MAEEKERQYETDTEGWKINPLLPRVKIEEMKTKSYYDKVRLKLMGLRNVYYKRSNYELLQFLMKEYYTFKSEYENLVREDRTARTLDRITKIANQIVLLINLYRSYLDSGVYITEETITKINVFINKLRQLHEDYKQLLIRYYS
jgi:hypothetical protein